MHSCYTANHVHHFTIRTHVHTHAHTHMHVHTCTHTHMHVHTHTCTHTRTHTHTHTHTHRARKSVKGFMKPQVQTWRQPMSPCKAKSPGLLFPPAKKPYVGVPNSPDLIRPLLTAWPSVPVSQQRVQGIHHTVPL